MFKKNVFGKCNRTDCFAYKEHSRNFKNNCQALDDEAMRKDFDKCTFYKKAGDRLTSVPEKNAKCHRTDCFAFKTDSTEFSNHCSALEDASGCDKCVFYKNKDSMSITDRISQLKAAGNLNSTIAEEIGAQTAEVRQICNENYI